MTLVVAPLPRPVSRSQWKTVDEADTFFSERHPNDHLEWVRTRIVIDQELLEAVRHGFSLIAVGFGSFSPFEGLTLGERAASELPKTFARIVTGVGAIVILLALCHNRKMTRFIDEDEFDTGPGPKLPDENRLVYLAAAAASIGIVSFVALLVPA